MSLPQARLVTRLQNLPAVTAIVGQNIFPELVPTLPQYPAVVFQVVSNVPYDDAGHGSNSFEMRLRVACLALATSPVGPYTQAWTLANAVCGDAEAQPGPTGLSGWVDAEGSVWHLDNEYDEAGEIRDGTESYWAYVVDQEYVVQYVRGS